MSNPFDFSDKPRKAVKKAAPAPPVGKSRRRQDVPVAKPFAPPPGYQGPVQTPTTKPALRGPVQQPTFAPPPKMSWADAGFLLRPLAWSLLAVVCMAVGWALFRSITTDPTDPSAVARMDPPEEAAPPPAASIPPPAKKEPAEPPMVPAESKPPEPKPAPEPMPTPPAGNLSFSKHVLPIFQARCVGCHSAQRRKGGLDVTTLAALLRGGDGGSSLKPGDPAQSKLWQSINSNEMPPGKQKVTPAEKKLIMEWIAQNAKP